MSRQLVNLGNGLVAPLPVGDTRTAEEIAQHVHTKPGPSRVVVGTGGKMLRWPDGHETGPIGGESLRNALKLGAVVIGEEPVKFANGPSVAAQQTEAAADLHHHVNAR